MTKSTTARLVNEMSTVAYYSGKSDTYLDIKFKKFYDELSDQEREQLDKAIKKFYSSASSDGIEHARLEIDDALKKAKRQLKSDGFFAESAKIT